MKSNIGDRIKRYEAASNIRLTPRSCLFIRVDGKSFHTYCKNKNKPFDNELIKAMQVAAQKTAKQMQGFKLAYVQSDECTFMLTDFDTLDTQGWFNYELNKVVSLSASYFTFFFNQYMGVDEVAVFDSRAFIVPSEDWPNVFIWRQRDWERNSLQMLARNNYTHSELNGKNSAQIHEMLYRKGLNWADLKPVYKNGTFIFQDETTEHIKLTYDNLVELVGL